eukprot:scaffold32045_cov29-Tisochrysis_lutea.AAC.4
MAWMSSSSLIADPVGCPTTTASSQQPVGHMADGDGFWWLVAPASGLQPRPMATGAPIPLHVACRAPPAKR